MNMNSEAEKNGIKNEEAELAALKAKLDRAVEKGAKVRAKINIAVKAREEAKMAAAEALKEGQALQKFKQGLDEDNYRSRKVMIRLANKVKERRIISQQA